MHGPALHGEIEFHLLASCCRKIMCVCVCVAVRNKWGWGQWLTCTHMQSTTFGIYEVHSSHSMSLHSNGVRMPHVYHQSPWPITSPCSHALAHSPRVLNIRSHIWTRREAGVHAHAAVSTMTRRNASTAATSRTTQPLPTVPSTMRAMVLPEPGPPGTMVERELPVRRPGDGEVLVRVDACAVAYVAPIRRACNCCQRPLTHN